MMEKLQKLETEIERLKEIIRQLKALVAFLELNK